ncbi:hypothetical protein C9374_007112 [Naegleria lovaniensis]|uniref:Uncharacterized protein n=1 Tax=Naegleria lovaniensis TaxID=51637 RepID=A0AA88H6M5_NAELO|nr:uncharacterized protein C9374_007112 [Naegleria lovaniensis]KAG2393581.1 hypothetical protein C9374_007112 [Naegleria lovaniensis]
MKYKYTLSWDHLLQAIQIQNEILEWSDQESMKISSNGNHSTPQVMIEYYKTLLDQCMKFLGTIPESLSSCNNKENETDNMLKDHLCHHWHKTWNELLCQFHDIHRQATAITITTQSVQTLRTMLCDLFKSTKQASAEYLFSEAITTLNFESSSTSFFENQFQNIQQICSLMERKFRNRIVKLSQHSMLYGVPLPTQGEEQHSACNPTSKVLSQSETIMACIYASFILHDCEMKIEAHSIVSILKAANIEIPEIYANIIANYFGRENNSVLKRVLELSCASSILEQVVAYGPQTKRGESNDSIRHEEKYGIPSSDEEFGLNEFF